MREKECGMSGAAARTGRFKMQMKKEKDKKQNMAVDFIYKTNQQRVNMNK